MKKNCCLLLLTLFYACFSFAQTPTYLPTNGLVGWYPFNGNANDESGNGNNGKVSGAVLTDDRMGIHGKAYKFNGVDCYIQIPNSSRYNMPTNASLTIAFWIKSDLNSSNTNTYIISKYSGSTENGAAFAIGTGVGGKLYSWTEPNPQTHRRGVELNGVKTINDGLWHLILYAISPDYVEFYVDGAKDAQGYYYGGEIINNLDLFIGCGANKEQFYSGAIDDIAIWNRALSDVEIITLYNKGLAANSNNSPNSTPSNIPISSTSNLEKVVGNSPKLTPRVFNLALKNSLGEKINIKEFRNIMVMDDAILSVVYSPPTGYIPNQGFPDIGHFLIKTDIRTGSSVICSSNDYNYETYNLNNRLSELNNLYSMAKGEAGVVFGSPNGSFTLPYEFEWNTNGNIETYEVASWEKGNNIAAFIASSKFDKKTYLFLYKNQSTNTLVRIDLGTIDNSFYSSYGATRFNGILEGKSIESGYHIEAVVKGESKTYVFLNIEKSLDGIILPVIIDENDKAKILTQSLFHKSRENCTEQGFAGSYNCTDGIFYMPVSKGFVNYHLAFNNGTNLLHLKYYNSNLTLVSQTTLTDIDIKHVYESGNYIIVGGYTTTKGYLGFPNPKIVVINKTTNSITYEKVIAKKNGEVDCITSTQSGDIVLGIGSYCCKGSDTDIDFAPLLIVDRLNDKGKFDNDLLQK